MIWAPSLKPENFHMSMHTFCRVNVDGQFYVRSQTPVAANDVENYADFLIKVWHSKSHMLSFMKNCRDVEFGLGDSSGKL